MSGGLVFDPLCAWCGGGGRVRAPWPNIGLSCHCGKRPKDTPKAPEPAATPPVDLENARRLADVGLQLAFPGKQIVYVAGSESQAEKGINFVTGAEPLGLRVFTRGRTTTRWGKEFIVWQREGQTLDALYGVLTGGAS